MNKRFKLAAFLAVAAIVAGLSGGAGATNAPTGAASAGKNGVARSTASTEAARRGALLGEANLKTIAGVKRYFRAIGVNPRGVVIQRGAHNYAGPRCPGPGWSCTSTAHPVVQVARRGGKNRFLCTTGSCAVVQATTSATKATKARSLTAAAVTNTAKCIKTTGVTQSCSISQTDATANNVAIVVQITSKMSGLTQTASHTAQITQQATGDSNTNTACVLQDVAVDGSTAAAKKGAPVTVTLNAHGSISVAQDAHGGDNTVKGSTAAGDCAVNSLTQKQTLTSNATGSASVVQNENATPTGANVLLDIEQNQSSGFRGSATGANTAVFSQTNSLTAVAATTLANGSVSQTQSSTDGGIQATVNQFSHGLSTAHATQTETQCEHAQVAGPAPLTCDTPHPPGYPLTQTQYGPISQGQRDPRADRRLAYVRKGPCCSTQADNDQNTFTINQSSTQNNDTGQTQTNTVQADCSTSGNCTATQTTQVNGQTTTNTQSGQNVNTSINCTGTTCSTPTITFDGSPGTNAPPSTLGPYTMTAFGPDPQPLGEVSGVSDPAGTIFFDPRLHHDTVPDGGWNNWSHGYTGDVYDTCFDNGSGCTAADPSHVRITLPAGTNAFYFYSEANTFDTFTLQATAQDGTTSGPVQVTTPGGAKYFGFYGTGGATLAHIDVTANDPSGFAVGEFGINPAAGIP
jgi:hypothetical protein